MPAHPAKTLPLVVANARHSPSYGCVLRLDRKRFGSLLAHAGLIHTFWLQDRRSLLALQEDAKRKVDLHQTLLGPAPAATMQAMLALLRTFSWQDLRHHPWRSAAAVVAGMLGVLGVDALLLPAMAPALMPRLWTGADRLALFAPATVFLNAAALQALGLPTTAPTLSPSTEPAPKLLLQAGLQQWPVQVAGTVAAGGAPLAVMDIGAAQDLFGRAGQLSRIDLQLQPGTDRSAWEAAVFLAGGVFWVLWVWPRGGAGGAPVLARGPVGAPPPRQRLALVLAESAVLGLVGSAAGIALGTALAAAALRLLGGDLGGGYFAGVQPVLQWSAPAALAYGALGVLAALVGGWGPARAPQTQPPA